MPKICKTSCSWRNVDVFSCFHVFFQLDLRLYSNVFHVLFHLDFVFILVIVFFIVFFIWILVFIFHLNFNVVKHVHAVTHVDCSFSFLDVCFLFIVP